MQEVPLLQIANTIAELKLMIPSPNANVLLIGKTVIGDGKGGFYRWDSTDTTSAEDTTFMNVIPSNVQGVSGRWVRTFQKTRTTAGGGVLVSNGGVKTYFFTASTNSSGEITLNITEENTANGTALFTEIWSITPSPQTNATGPADAVQSYRKALAANLKTTTYGFYKANAVTIILGLLYNPFASIGAGTNVQFRVEGV